MIWMIWIWKKWTLERQSAFVTTCSVSSDKSCQVWQMTNAMLITVDWGLWSLCIVLLWQQTSSSSLDWSLGPNGLSRVETLTPRRRHRGCRNCRGKTELTSNDIIASFIHLCQCQHYSASYKSYITKWTAIEIDCRPGPLSIKASTCLNGTGMSFERSSMKQLNYLNSACSVLVGAPYGSHRVTLGTLRSVK